MYYRCELILNGQSYEATDDLKNWEDITIAYKRASLDGVVRSFASSFEFAGGTAAVLRNAFLSHGLGNDANVIIYLQNNSWTWNELFRCKADVSTVSITPDTVSFNCIDDSIQAKLKANKGTRYEFPEAQLADRTLVFERLLMNNWEKFTLVIESNDENGKFMSGNYVYTDGQNGRYKLPLYYTENSIPVPGAIELYDQQSTKIANVADQGFLVCKKDVTVHLRLKLKIHGGWLGSSEYRPQMYLQKWSSQYSTYSTIQASNDYFDGIMTTQMTLDVDRDISLVAGDTLLVTVQVPVISESSLENGRALFTVHSFRDDETGATMKVSWQDRGSAVGIRCFKPQKMLQALLDKLCGEGAVSGILDDSDDERLRNTVLAAADSIRDLPNPIVYSSFQNFCNFMEANYGYVYKTSRNSVTFMHRDKLFGTGKAKDIREARNIEISADSSLIYSTIEVGNEGKDYGEENGLFEFNARQTYTTGESISSNTLTLAPDYRSDCYGIEYLTEKREQDTTDDKSDKDIWAIIAKTYGEELKPDMDTAIVAKAGQNTSGLFNALLHPRYCIMANESLLATFARNLRYASSDGNTDYTIGGNSLTSNIQPQSRRYTPFTLKFDTADISEPSSLEGKISITHNGKSYSGWLQKLEIHPTRQRSAGYTIAVDAETIGN